MAPGGRGDAAGPPRRTSLSMVAGQVAALPRRISGRIGPMVRGFSMRGPLPKSPVAPPRREAAIFRHLPQAMRALDAEGLGGSHAVSLGDMARRDSRGADASVPGQDVTIGSAAGAELSVVEESPSPSPSLKRISAIGTLRRKDKIKALRVETHLLARGLAVFLSLFLTWILFVSKILVTFVTKRQLAITFDAVTSIGLLTCPIIDPLQFLFLDRGFRSAFVEGVTQLSWRRSKM
ncbi:hypothetical protein H9P43_004236 [Blastocladiella emersonii ATCC 22665]|nr:hypothetical protein H9P43_004236 [Blastocladiella emersonii ATCC 22665]